MDVIYKNIINFFAVVIGLFFFCNGMAMLLPSHHFIAIYNHYWPEQSLMQHGLGLFGRFIGYVFVLLGFSLFTLKFRLLSAFVLLLLQINMLVFSVCLGSLFDVLFVSTLLGFTSLVLIKDRRTLQVFLGVHTPLYVYKPDNNNNNLMWVIGCLIMLNSIQLAKINIYIAYSAIALGCLISLRAYWLDSKRLFEPM
jgi:hypothetical protein